MRNYLSSKLNAEIREANQEVRDLQRKIYELKCEYVTEEEYYVEEAKKYLPMKIAFGLGVLNLIVIGIQVYAYFSQSD